MITASKLELARLCPGHASLPQHDSRSVDAEAGVERHKAWEVDITAGRIPEELDERWPDVVWESEVPFAWDMATGHGRQLVKGQHRDYAGLGPFEIAGTADVVGRGPHQLVVVDRKGFDRVPAAVANLQTGIAALAFASIHHRDVVQVGIYYEAAPFDVAELDVFSLEAMAETIRLVMRTSASDKALNEGEHCKYCPAFGSCPKKQKLALEVMTETPDERLAMLLPLRDDATAANAYAFAERLRELLKRLDAAVYARANEAPIPLGDGLMFGKVSKLSNEKLDGDVVYAVLKELHGQEVADAAVIRSATKDRIKKALSVIGGRGQVAAMERSTMAEVRNRGGAKREMRDSFDEYPSHELKPGVSGPMLAAAAPQVDAEFDATDVQPEDRT